MDLEKRLVNGFRLFDHSEGAQLYDRLIRGEYNRRRFVLSLADDIHEELQNSDLQPGEVTFSAASGKTTQAFSTYLHETIHWWQHIGSFSGFVQTCMFPAATHLNQRRLKNIIQSYGPQKSVLQLLNLESRKAFSPSIDDLNVVVNNMKDIDFFVAAIQSPSNLHIIKDDKFFEGRGHSFYVAYSAMISALSAFDAEFNALPDPRSWEQARDTLRAKKTMEFFYRSTVRIPPIGLHALFEGQARFSQMQYLYQASGNTLQWEDFRTAGMLGDIYVEAFELFLKLIDIEMPDNVLSSEVGLFLLVCDLAINPTDGFPLQIKSFDTFLDDVDPGTRFLRLCEAVVKDRRLLNEINEFTREEYIKTSGTLCNLAGINSPTIALDKVSEWVSRSPEIGQIVAEGRSFKFGEVNMPLRLLVAQFLRFCEDKRSNPEYFCWPGARVIESKAHERATELFEKHQALFTNRADKRGVYPRIIAGIDPRQSVDTLSEFYQGIAIYDITRQWILNDGVFDLSFDWLSDGGNEEVFQWANDTFESIFGVRPENFEVL